MAKKVERKIMVMRRMTENGIKSLGTNLWIQRNLTKLILVAAGYLVVMILLSNVMPKGLITNGIVIALLAVGLVWLYWAMDKAGKKYYDTKAKGKPEPIDLG